MINRSVFILRVGFFMNNVIVSVVLYNSSKQEVENLIACFLSNVSVKMLVFVDNGGCSWVEKYSSERVVYLKAEYNGGYGYGHNLAMSKYLSQCDYYIVSNPDISFPDCAIDELVDVASLMSFGLIMPNIVYPDGRRQELCKLLPNPLHLFSRRFLPFLAEWLDSNYLLRSANYSETFFCPSLSGCFMFFKREAIEVVGGFDERFFMYLEDIDLSRRVAEGFGAFYVPDVTVTHDFRKSSYSDRRMLYAHVKSAIKYFNKWGWFFDRGRNDMNSKCRRGIKKFKKNLDVS